MSLKSSARGIVYAAEKLIQRLRFASLPAPAGGWPILLGISFPKSGTHLLDQILVGFSRVAPFSLRVHSFYAEYEGDSGLKHPPDMGLAWLDSLRSLDVASAHLFARPAAAGRVCTPAFVPYFIFRDPRDVVVSHVFYVTEMETSHVHHAYYASLPDFDSRLRVSILGNADLGIEFPDIAARFAPYIGWLQRSEVMKIKFEALIADRAPTLGRIVDHLLARVPLNVSRGELVKVLESAVDPGRSPTFRSGQTGEWRQRFTPEHKRLFKSVAGDLLLHLGYEASNDW
jgi:hypothetical protein